VGIAVTVVLVLATIAVLAFVLMRKHSNTADAAAHAGFVATRPMFMDNPVFNNISAPPAAVPDQDANIVDRYACSFLLLVVVLLVVFHAWCHL
jgi:hypothetical protein